MSGIEMMSRKRSKIEEDPDSAREKLTTEGNLIPDSARNKFSNDSEEMIEMASETRGQTGRDSKTTGEEDREADEMEDGKQATKMSEREDALRKRIGDLLNKSKTGEYFSGFLSLISILSSLTWVVLTYFDHSLQDPCCVCEYKTTADIAWTINGNLTYDAVDYCVEVEDETIK